MVATCPAYLEIIAPGSADSKNCHIVNHPALYHAPPSRAFFLWPVHLWWRISPALFPNPVLCVLPRSGIVAPATSCSRQLQPQLCEGAGYEYRPETGGSHDSSVPASHPSVDASHVSYTLHLGLTTLVISNYFLYLKERVWFAQRVLWTSFGLSNYSQSGGGQGPLCGVFQGQQVAGIVQILKLYSTVNTDVRFPEMW